MPRAVADTLAETAPEPVPEITDVTQQHARDEHEIKFAVPMAQVDVFFAETGGRLSPQVYDEALPVAFSRTTYLDTPDLEYLASSKESLSRRLRIREYAGAAAAGEPVRLMDLCYLEYKESHAGQRRKARVRIAAHDIAEILQKPARLVDSLRNPSRSELRSAQVLMRELEGKRLLPQLTTWYRRQSLRDADGSVRVTLDTELAFCHPVRPGAESAGEPVLPAERVAGHAPACLLEVKSMGAPPTWLDRAMRRLGKPPGTRLSKYAMGMRMLLAPEEDVSGPSALSGETGQGRQAEPAGAGG
ncbi:MAG TPA: VTC domain-containing protein [Haliangium sp.]|nr:VTC domain-containing protein [Haliangium sp.]